MRVLVAGDPRSYALQIESSYNVLAPVAPAYNGVVEYDDEQPAKVIPALAEKWDTSPDGRLWTFQIRKGVTWHDGKPLTATDVEYSLKRIMANSVELRDP